MRAAPLLLLCAPAALAAQSPVYERERGGVGIEVRTYAFQRGIQLRRATQVALPLFGGAPLGRRVFVDVTGSYATTELTSYDGAVSRLTGLTDTQVRTSYTAGHDAAVFSLAVNLPTGQSTIARDQLAIIRSAGQNFLPFPVSRYGGGYGLTGGVAMARRVGAWSLGLAGSLRYLGSYEPFSDVSGQYTPGLESRVRIGARRLFGQRTSVAAGLTFSTFGTDEFTGVPAFEYRPGNRIIGELAVSRQVHRATIRLAGWLYSRGSGDSSGAAVVKARERIADGTALVELPVGRSVFVEAGLEARSWQPAGQDGGSLVGLRLGGRRRIGSALTFAAMLRADTGWIRLDLGRANLSGLSLAAFVLVGS